MGRGLRHAVELSRGCHVNLNVRVCSLDGRPREVTRRPQNGLEFDTVRSHGVRRETFCRTGGFDPGMRQLGGNDNEISCRFWLLGYELLVVPAVEVGHLFRMTTPYEARWTALVHNRLRMAFVHFGASRVERVLNALRVYNAFPAAMAMMLDTDVFARRALVAGDRRFDDAWYFQKFALEC